MKPRYFKLDADKNPVPLNSVFEFAKMFEDDRNRRVDFTELDNGVCVSTVFLGLDHAWYVGYDGPPILFETMIFGGEHDEYQERYHTWDEAKAGHQRAIELINKTKS